MKILIIGAGYMAGEYFKVLKNFSKDITVVCRSHESANKFKEKYKIDVTYGGIDDFVETNNEHFDFVFNCADVSNLMPITKLLLGPLYSNIIVEKPGSLLIDEVEAFEDAENVYIAFNRPYFKSIKKLLDISESDGGITSCRFEFTEWSDEIKSLNKPIADLENWGYINSTHILQLVFSLIGLPQKLDAHVVHSLDWHKRGAIFVGAGISCNNIPFSYHSNWDSAGRWEIEFCSKNYRFVLKPLEKLNIIKRNSVNLEEYDLGHDHKDEFKDGLFELVEDVLGEKKNILTIKQFKPYLDSFRTILNYE